MEPTQEPPPELTPELIPDPNQILSASPARPGFWQGLGQTLGQKLGMDARHRRYFLDALWLALTLRGMLLIFAYIAGRIIEKSADPIWYLVFKALSRWDTLNYYILAEEGYTFSGPHQPLLAFFPVFPWLLRPLGYLTQNYFTPGVLISGCSAVIAGYYLQALVALDYDDETAHRALKYFFLFPTAYFLALPYTESLFLALTLGSWYEARRGRWGIAGVAGLLSSLTRLQGLVLFPALLLEAWMQRRERPWWRMLGVLLVPMGFGIYMLMNWKIAGSPLAFTLVQKSYWSNQMVPPWEPLKSAMDYVLHAKPTEQGTSVEVMRLWTFGLTALSLLLGVRRLRLTYQLYAWAQFTMAMLSSWLMSLPRYVLCLFPLFIIYATQSRNPAFHERLLLISTMLMSMLAFIFCTGHWAY